jgi:hypothetical protein
MEFTTPRRSLCSAATSVNSTLINDRLAAPLEICSAKRSSRAFVLLPRCPLSQAHPGSLALARGSRELTTLWPWLP